MTAALHPTFKLRILSSKSTLFEFRIEGRQMSYQDHITAMNQLIDGKNGTWGGIDAESVARMRVQNRFKICLDIARYKAGIMRRDMAAYDADPTQYTQSLGCWHG